jgi:hypothetical protein
MGSISCHTPEIVDCVGPIRAIRYNLIDTDGFVRYGVEILIVGTLEQLGWAIILIQFKTNRDNGDAWPY